jgi:uncharacterized repeat protein (TIGR04002 family)
MKTNASLRGWVTSGLFAALIFLATYLFHIPTAHGGYIHVGDTIIYLAASLMPLPFAAPCAALGGALSDALSPGGTVWIIPTLIIKPVLTLFFTSKCPKIICRRNIAAIFIAGIAGVAGYDLFSAIMYNNFIAPLLQLPIDILQPIASGILFVLVGGALDKVKIKQRFDFSFKSGKNESHS